MSQVHPQLVDGIISRLGVKSQVLPELYRRAVAGVAGNYRSEYGAKLVYDVQVEVEEGKVTATDARSGFKVTLTNGKLRIDRAIAVELDSNGLTTFNLFV